jgi:hypothetical protein
MAQLSASWQRGHAALTAASAAPNPATALGILTSRWMKPKMTTPLPSTAINGRVTNAGAASAGAAVPAQQTLQAGAVGRRAAPAPRALPRSAAQPHARPAVHPAAPARPTTAPVRSMPRRDPIEDPSASAQAASLAAAYLAAAAASADAQPPAPHPRPAVPTFQGRAGGGRAGGGASCGRGRGAVALAAAQPVPARPMPAAAASRPVSAAPQHRRPDPPTRELLVPLLPMPWDAPPTQPAMGAAPPKPVYTAAAIAGRGGGRGYGRDAYPLGPREGVSRNPAAHGATALVVPPAAAPGQGMPLGGVTPGADTLEARARSAGSAWDPQQAGGAPVSGGRHVRGGGPRGGGGRYGGRLGGRGRG